MFKTTFLAAALTAAVLIFPLQGKELFHFDFKDAGGKWKIRSGAFELRSKRVPLLTQSRALRLAATAEIEISGALPDFRKGFAVMKMVQ